MPSQPAIKQQARWACSIEKIQVSKNLTKRHAPTEGKHYFAVSQRNLNLTNHANYFRKRGWGK